MATSNPFPSDFLPTTSHTSTLLIMEDPSMFTTDDSWESGPDGDSNSADSFGIIAEPNILYDMFTSQSHVHQASLERHISPPQSFSQSISPCQYQFAQDNMSLESADSDPTEEQDNADCSPGSRRKRSYSSIAHNKVERKYRDNLNAELHRLRQVIPNISEIRQLTKAQILASAISYIQELEFACGKLKAER
jgi:hypothetical protein